MRLETRLKIVQVHCKKFQVVSTNYYLVTSSTEILRSVNSIYYFLVGSTFTEML